LVSFRQTEKGLLAVIPGTSKRLALAAVLLLSAVAVAQQNPDGQLPVGSAAEPYLFLIRDPVVHEELRLSAEKRRAVAVLNDELDGPLWSMRNRPAQEQEETRQEVTATAKERLASILTSGQATRLRQIELRVLGTKALLRDDLATNLGLSEDQREEIQKTIGETQEAFRDFAKQVQSGQDQKAAEKAARKLQSGAQKKILATLTRRQQEEWVALLGRQIDLAELGRVKFKVPVLSGQEDWINSSPLAAEQLRGKVVALYFYAYG
jgi:hypothetical protein